LANILDIAAAFFSAGLRLFCGENAVGQMIGFAYKLRWVFGGIVSSTGVSPWMSAFKLMP